MAAGSVWFRCGEERQSSQNLPINILAHTYIYNAHIHTDFLHQYIESNVYVSIQAVLDSTERVY